MPDCRLFLDTELQTGIPIAIPSGQAHYLRHVMRLSSGDQLTLFNGRGGEYTATIEKLAREHASCMPIKFSDVNRELPCRVHIIQCANKSEKIETVLQKATELGAASFQIANSERSQFKLGANKLDSRLERWQKIIIEAAEQSGRTALPELTWRPSLKEVAVPGKGFALHPEAAVPWSSVREEIRLAPEITFAIGPEGGFSSRDLEILGKQGLSVLAFGPRVMRTETAAPALLAALQSLSD